MGLAELTNPAFVLLFGPGGQQPGCQQIEHSVPLYLIALSSKFMSFVLVKQKMNSPRLKP